MAVTYVTLYPPGGNSTQVQVVEGSQLHLIYASMGFSVTPAALGPPTRPDPFPQYVHDDELGTLLGLTFSPADPVLSDFVYDPATGNLLSYKEDGIPIVLTYNADGTVATSKRGNLATKTYGYSGGNLVGVA